VVHSNRASAGGGVFLRSCALAPFTHSTLADNTGGGLYFDRQLDCREGPLLGPFRNNIIATNTGGGVSGSTAFLPLQSSDVWGNLPQDFVAPAPDLAGVNGNVAFDSMANPVSVNIAFFDVCEGCPAGTQDLEGTGFDIWDDAGATTWLRTQAPVEGGQEFTIRFAIWDTGDSALDSTVLIDNFQWIAEPVGVGTNPID